ncbi:jg25232 [Pararge aegeria aegeria]|uniref:Jg25232 protein n=1 Tax=Pararge aegeria aegeria TaxID=348720 RepID=A0A8S4RX97_9NEOP|nr:jg25232 [Pararge aegeria aegeria]
MLRFRAQIVEVMRSTWWKSTIVCNSPLKAQQGDFHIANTLGRRAGQTEVTEDAALYIHSPVLEKMRVGRALQIFAVRIRNEDAKRFVRVRGISTT